MLLYCCVYPLRPIYGSKVQAVLKFCHWCRMYVVGRSASLATARRFALGRVSNRGYICAVTHRLDLIDSPSFRIRQRRHLTTTLTSRHAEPLSTYLDFRFSTDTTMASLTPPQPPPSWQHTVEDIERLTTEALARDKQISDNIVQLPEDKLGFDNVSPNSDALLLSPIADRLTTSPFFSRCLCVDPHD